MTALRKSNPVKSHLRVVKGSSQNKTETLVSNAWNFTQAALWNKESFTQTEIKEFKKLIAQHFETAQDKEKFFIEFCERVCLAKRYVSRQQGRYIAQPINWLNINYRFGIIGTQRWYNEISEQRKTVPHYNRGINLLARAVYKYAETRSEQVFHAARKKFIGEKQFDLLQIFYNTLININF